MDEDELENQAKSVNNFLGLANKSFRSPHLAYRVKECIQLQDWLWHRGQAVRNS